MCLEFELILFLWMFLGHEGNNNNPSELSIFFLKRDRNLCL